MAKKVKPKKEQEYRKMLVKLMRHVYTVRGDISKARMAEIMGMSLIDFLAEFEEEIE